MYGVNPKRQAAGAAISAKMLREFADQIARLARLTVGAGLKLIYVKGSPVISLDEPHPVRHACTTSDISPRSGNTLGFGTAQLCYLDGDGGIVLTSTNEDDVTIYNNTVGTVPSGTYCMVARVGSLLCLIEADCPGGDASPASP